jgi:hypothetical protein
LIKTLLLGKQPHVKQGLPVEKKTCLTAALISVLLLTALVGAQFAGLAKGNPFSQSAYSGESPPSTRVDPPEISILSPQDNRTYNTRDVSLSLNVSTKGSKDLILTDLHFISSIGVKEVYYTADWLPSENMVYRGPSIEDWINNTAKFFYMDDWYDNYQDLPEIDFEKLSLNLTNIPDGNHTISVYAVGSGSEYYIFNWYIFYVTRVSKVNFVIDTTPPTVAVLQIANKTFADSEVPLNFTVNELVSRISNVLDGQDNFTLLGNTTLADLPFGEHNITVYAWDTAGNVGASETITFTIAQPLPAGTVAAASVAVAASVSAGILVYFKKRKR